MLLSIKVCSRNYCNTHTSRDTTTRTFPPLGFCHQLDREYRTRACVARMEYSMLMNVKTYNTHENSYPRGTGLRLNSFREFQILHSVDLNCIQRAQIVFIFLLPSVLKERPWTLLCQEPACDVAYDRCCCCTNHMMLYCDESCLLPPQDLYPGITVL